MTYLLPIFALELLCLWHCLKNGRKNYWIYVIFLFPLAGCLVYFLLEVWPDMQRKRNHVDRGDVGRYRPAPQVQQAVQQAVKQSPALKTQEQLGDEFVQRGLYAEAIDAYKKCLQGPLENDPEILFRLAQAAFHQQDFAQSIDALNRIRALSDYKNAEVRLLLARSYQSSHQDQKAENLYKQLLKSPENIEAMCHYASYLQELGQDTQAEDLFARVISHETYLPPSADVNQKVWIEYARQHMNPQNTHSS